MTAMAQPRPLRVLHVTPGLDMGGLEKLLVEFARHADRQRHDLRFVSLGGRGLLAEPIEHCGWPVHALEVRPGLRPGLILRLAALFRRERPDVVHTHNTRALVYGGPAARLARVPRLIHTWHGLDLQGTRRENLLFRLAGRLPDRVVAVSEDAGRQLLRRGISEGRLRTLRNGIDVARFAYAGPRNGGPVVTVARLSPEKDIATLVRAADLVRRQQPGFRLEVAGDGPCLPELQALVDALALEGHVHFLGQVNDVPALLARASLFVLPSLTEGISLTLLEAAARGLPVVATRVGGNPEVVEDSLTGLLVPPGRPEELAAAILRLLGDPESARAMGRAGRERVEEHFDVRRMVAGYEALYQEGRRQPPRVAGHALPVRPRVLSNLPGLARPPADALLANVTLPLDARPLWGGLRAFLESFTAGAVVVNQADRALMVLCTLRALLPLARAPLVSVDLVLAPPANTFGGRIKGLLKRWLLRQVRLFLVHMKDVRAWQRYYGIAAGRTRYLPFKVNWREDVLGRDAPEGAYVFTGGKSRRDYRTFVEALGHLGYPGMIVAPEAAESAAHGTSLDGLDLPANVLLVHDDGSGDSWITRMAGARLVVFCIAPETISPSGVSGYLLAMALGKCVIISDCPATRGILVPDETAILVPMRDTQALAEAVRKAWNDGEYRRRVAEGGYRYALGLGGEETLMGNIARAVLDLLRGSG
jgi:glycosyltransferase involved in cell wall biosynthesis